MSSETHDPMLGTPEPDVSSPQPLTPAGPPAPAPPSSTSSGDELSALLTDSIIHPEPDPFLGEFPSKGQPSGEPTSDSGSELVSKPESKSEPERRPHFDPVGPDSPEAAVVSVGSSGPSPTGAALPLDLGLEHPPKQPAGSDTADSFDGLAALASITGLRPSESPASGRTTKPIRSEVGDLEAEEGDDDDDDETASPRSSWLTLLLVSYASAVTLGLFWVLISGRKLREGDDVNLFPATANQVDPGRRADQSRKVVPPAPLAADHLVALDQTIRLDSLEVTPLEVSSGRVRLEGAFDESEQRIGGRDALRLTLRLKNVSPDMIFVPLDEAFIRERVVGSPDSFIETSQGGLIAMYPLAVASEWSIQGQTFKELQPGESFEAEVVSASEVSDRLTPEMTWRVRLRTGIDQTDTLGVRFRKDQIQPGS